MINHKSLYTFPGARLIMHSESYFYFYIPKKRNFRSLGHASLLKLSRTYFHLSFLHRSIIAFPVIPINPIGSSLIFLKVLAVEARIVAVFIPPGTLVTHSAVCSPHIIISVFGGEFHSVVIFQ